MVSWLVCGGGWEGVVVNPCHRGHTQHHHEVTEHLDAGR